VVPLIVAGIGIAMCFPTVANAVVAAVPIEDSGSRPAPTMPCGRSVACSASRFWPPGDAGPALTRLAVVGFLLARDAAFYLFFR
jgi:hypothetical protein